jgi:hypothetical protein
VARADTARPAVGIAAPRIIQPPTTKSVINGRATAEPTRRAALDDIENADWVLAFHRRWDVLECDEPGSLRR